MKFFNSRIAEAQIELARVRHARLQFLSAKMSEPYYESRASTRMKIAIMQRLLRPNAPDIPNLEEFLTATPEGPKKFVRILSQETKALLTMDRYERRALSRRKFAIRALDLARQQATKP